MKTFKFETTKHCFQNPILPIRPRRPRVRLPCPPYDRFISDVIKEYRRIYTNLTYSQSCVRVTKISN